MLADRFPATLVNGKFYLFRAVLRWFYPPGYHRRGNPLVSAYYLRVVVTMYMQDGDPVTEREFWRLRHRRDRAGHTAACPPGLCLGERGGAQVVLKETVS
jgi:hypothetical protein